MCVVILAAVAVEQLVLALEGREAVGGFFGAKAFLLGPLGFVIMDELGDALFEVGDVVREFVVDCQLS